MKTLIDRASRVSDAIERLHWAAEGWAETRSTAFSEHERIRRANVLSERAVQYTQALQALAKGGAK